jgi:hypothetical protein
VFALGGTAVAAKHYLITSTGQIKPSVLKQLKGNVGPRGPQGIQGELGPRGIAGPQGAQGFAGAAGAPGANAVGVTGNEGEEGLKGATGEAGPTGPAGANGTNGAIGARGETGATGPSGGPAGPTGPTGPEGSGGTGGTGLAGCTPALAELGDTKLPCLTKGQQEQGTWSASIAIPMGGPQVEASGAISFPFPLDEASRELMKVRYMDETEVLSPTEHEECVGSSVEPVATEGWLCVYQGATATEGSLKTEWKEAGFYAVLDPQADTCKPEAGKESGVLNCTGAKNFQIGALVAFRTKTFKEPPTVLPAAAVLSAGGSWAVRAPK